MLGLFNKVMHVRPGHYHRAYGKPLINVSCYFMVLLPSCISEAEDVLSWRQEYNDPTRFELGKLSVCKTQELSLQSVVEEMCPGRDLSTVSQLVSALGWLPEGHLNIVCV